MSWIAKILGSGFSGLADGVSKILGAAGVENADQKAAIGLEIQKLANEEARFVADEIMAEMSSKEKILVAELNQGDSYTKRARPTVVYAGLVILVVNHIFLPWFAYFAGMVIPTIDIPGIFWTGWSGIVMTWSVGRSMEKRGIKNKIINKITGG